MWARAGLAVLVQVDGRAQRRDLEGVSESSGFRVWARADLAVLVRVDGRVQRRDLKGFLKAVALGCGRARTSRYSSRSTAARSDRTWKGFW